MNTHHIITDLDTTIGPWLGRTVKMVDYHIQEAFKAHHLDLTKEQVIILKILTEKGVQNQNELACSTYRDKSSLARLLTTMENKGYIIRKHDKNDKRMNHVHITNSGSALFEKGMPIIKDLIDQMQNNLSTEEINNTIKTLQKLQYNLNPELNSF